MEQLEKEIRYIDQEFWEVNTKLETTTDPIEQMSLMLELQSLAMKLYNYTMEYRKLKEQEQQLMEALNDLSEFEDSDDERND